MKKLTKLFQMNRNQRAKKNRVYQNVTRLNTAIPSNLVVKMQGNTTKYYKKHIVYQDLPKPIPSSIRYYYWDDDSIGMLYVIIKDNV